MNTRERIEELRSELSQVRQPSPWEYREFTEPLIQELQELELMVFGDPSERVAIKRTLRRAGIPFDMQAPMHDLVLLTSFIPKQSH